MQVYALYDRVDVTVPDPTDSDHRYHGAIGRVVAVRRSTFFAHTGDARHDYLYRVAFKTDSDAEMLFRHDNLDQVPA